MTPQPRPFEGIARSHGVFEEAILLDRRSTNTGENIILSRALIERSGIDQVKTVTLVTMPFMERRAYATCRRVWPEVDIVCASEPDGYEEYVARHGDERQIIRLPWHCQRGRSCQMVEPAPVTWIDAKRSGALDTSWTHWTTQALPCPCPPGGGAKKSCSY